MYTVDRAVNMPNSPLNVVTICCQLNCLSVVLVLDMKGKPEKVQELQGQLGISPLFMVSLSMHRNILRVMDN